MACIVLLNADDPTIAEIAQDDVGNLFFDHWTEADEWIQENAKVGWCTRIIDLDD